jgi:hypothetical protein
MQSLETSTPLVHSSASGLLTRLLGPLLRGACRSMAVAAEVCGATLFDDGVERPEVGWRGPFGPVFSSANPGVDWELCSDLERAIIARELGAGGPLQVSRP